MFKEIDDRLTRLERRVLQLTAHVNELQKITTLPGLQKLQRKIEFEEYLDIALSSPPATTERY